MSVKKVNGKWTARAWWTDENGKQRNKQKGGFKTKAAAEAWEKQTIEDGLGKKPLKPRGLPITLADLHEAYREHLTRRNSSPTTMANYDQGMTRMCEVLGKDARLDALTRLDVQRAVDALVQRGLAPRTVRSFLGVLRTELNYAEGLECIGKNPCRHVDMPPVSPHAAVIYEPADLVALYDALRETDHPLLWPVLFCGFHGMRRGEALGVRWQDIDLDEGLLHVRANLVNVPGQTVLKRPKTAASADTVALMDETVDALRELRHARATLTPTLYWSGKPCSPDEPIPYADLDPREFVCLDRAGRILKPSTLDGQLHTFQRANNLLVSGWHDLRHTYATLLCEAGEDVTTIQRALRHDSVQTTANMYIQGTTKIKRRATERFGQIVQFSGATKKDSEQ